ncbi:MAG: sigma-70 family RNA polymerase sigma factor, partial [Actinobacteria bacterium]|nr:sigma-70 family RNA polymerase sigma factor [Actinomycetota bacterium]
MTERQSNISKPADDLDDLGQLSLLRLYRETGDRQALESLVEQMMPWVRRVAGRYTGRGFEIDELAQVAAVGLFKAIERFDPARGVQLETYAEPTITGEIKRHFRDHGWMVRPPRDLQELNAKVMRAIDELTKLNPTSPTVTAIAEHLQVGEEDVLEAIHAGGGYSAAPLDPPDDGSESAPREHPGLAVDDGDFERLRLRHSIGAGLGELSERDRAVIHMRFFQDMTQSEIALQVGVS